MAQDVSGMFAVGMGFCIFWVSNWASCRRDFVFKKRASYSGMVSSEFGTVPLFPSGSEVGTNRRMSCVRNLKRGSLQKNETPERML
jgi:hypothetical protein